MTQQTPQNQDRIVRIPELLALLGVKDPSTIYRWLAKGAFPKPFKLAAGSTQVGWMLSEVQAFIQQRRDGGAA